jgi:hypothetical protein
MNKHKQPEALRLADAIAKNNMTLSLECATELRRLHSEDEQLREFLKEIYYQHSIQGDR